MKTGVFSEYLGNVSTDDLLTHITNRNPESSSIESLREMNSKGFTVSVEFERPYAEKPADQQRLDEAMERVDPEDPTTYQPKPVRFIRIVLEEIVKADATAA